MLQWQSYCNINASNLYVVYIKLLKILYIKYISIKNFIKIKFLRAYYVLDALNTLIHVILVSVL